MSSKKVIKRKISHRGEESKNLDRLNPRHHLRRKVCISGAAETGLCSKNAVTMAEEVGRELAKRKIILVTGAAPGIPYWAAKGAKEAGGLVIGVSPASCEKEHVEVYRLPIDYHDVILYTGVDYVGRNLLLTTMTDAMITICGLVGTLNEFTAGFLEDKPTGVLEGSGGAADMLREILTVAKRGYRKTVFSRKPKDLVRKLITLIEESE